MASDAGAALYDYLRVKHKVDKKLPSSEFPHPILKDWKRQWVVLTTHLSPLECHISYCSKEEDWLVNNDTINKLYLKTFEASRLDPAAGSKKSNEQIIEITFLRFSLLILFDSMSKLQQWLDELKKIRTRFYTELVKSPDHPEREREYVMEVCANKLKLWLPQHNNVLSFEWKLSHIRRAQYFNVVSKVEIEVGRASETGEGKFYFIGPNMSDMFAQLKEKIQTKARAAHLLRRGEQISIRESKVNSPDTIELQQMDTMSNGSLDKDEEKEEKEEDGSGSDFGSGGSKASDVRPPPPPRQSAISDVPSSPKQRHDKDEVKLSVHGQVEFINDTPKSKRYPKDSPDFQLPSFASSLKKQQSRHSKPAPLPPLPPHSDSSSFTPSTSSHASVSPSHVTSPLPQTITFSPRSLSREYLNYADPDDTESYQPLSAKSLQPVSYYEALQPQDPQPDHEKQLTREDCSPAMSKETSYTTMLPPPQRNVQRKNMSYYNTK